MCASLLSSRLCGYAFAAARGAAAARAFCAENGLSEPTLERAHALRKQLTRLVHRREAAASANGAAAAGSSSSSSSAPSPAVASSSLAPLSREREALLLQAFLSSNLDNVARRVPRGGGDAAPPPDKGKPESAAARRLRTCAYESASGARRHGGEPLYVHPHSFAFARGARDLPEWVVFTQVGGWALRWKERGRWVGFCEGGGIVLR